MAKDPYRLSALTDLQLNTTGRLRIVRNNNNNYSLITILLTRYLFNTRVNEFIYTICVINKLKPTFKFNK